MRLEIASGHSASTVKVFSGQVCWHIVNRTTIKLPEELDARLRHEAQRRGITISELTREAIETHLGSRRQLAAAGAGRSGRDDISERIEEILAGDVTPSH